MTTLKTLDDYVLALIGTMKMPSAPTEELYKEVVTMAKGFASEVCDEIGHWIVERPVTQPQKPRTCLRCGEHPKEQP